MQQIKLLLPAIFLIIAAGCSDHDHSDQGHSHDDENTTINHDSI